MSQGKWRRFRFWGGRDEPTAPATLRSRQRPRRYSCLCLPQASEVWSWQRSPAANFLLSPSEGGKARARKLSPGERTRIAREAAQARWLKDAREAAYTGALKIGEESHRLRRAGRRHSSAGPGHCFDRPRSGEQHGSSRRSRVREEGAVPVGEQSAGLRQRRVERAARAGPLSAAGQHVRAGRLLG